MQALEPIHVTPLFPKLEARLIELLKSLSDEDWHKPTVCAFWNVKDLAAHLLDGNLRRLSTSRDHYFGGKPENFNSYRDLVDYLNRLNADWVKAAKRLSPAIIIGLLEQTGRQVFELFKSLDPHQPALYPVAWAGEEKSENWFDIAREYSEKWHHQQQIRLAVDQPGIMERELYFPVLDTFMRALPFTYRSIEAADGALIKFIIKGEAGGVWFLLRQSGRWQLVKETGGVTASEVSLKQEIAWRLFTKGIEKELVKKEMQVTGDQRLGWEVINMLGVMA